MARRGSAWSDQGGVSLEELKALRDLGALLAHLRVRLLGPRNTVGRGLGCGIGRRFALRAVGVDPVGAHRERRPAALDLAGPYLSILDRRSRE